MNPLHECSTLRPARGTRGGDAARSRSSRCLSSASMHAPSHNLKPGRRRAGPRCHTTTFTIAQTLFLTLLTFAAVSGISEGRTISGAGLAREGAFGHVAKRGLHLADQVHARGDRHVDIAPRENAMVHFTNPHDATPVQTSTRLFALSQTTNVATAKPSPNKALTTATVPSPTSTPTDTTSSGSATSPSASSAASDIPLPTPFDTSIGSNFTQSSCPDFFDSFLGDAVFTKCLPFSLLLQNSNSFFQATGSNTAVDETLTASCNAIFPTCPQLMDSLALQIRDPANCGADYALENPLVRQAYAGFVAYKPLYDASCLKNPDNSTEYCYAEAVLNPAASPADGYIYYLPLGVALPGGSRPTCNKCVQKTMNIFAGYAGNLTQPLSGDYLAAATYVNAGCGPSFVNTTIAVDKGSQPNGAVGGFGGARERWAAVLVAGVVGLLV